MQSLKAQKTSKSRFKYLSEFVCVSFLILASLFLLLEDPFFQTDPDHFYHLSVSREIAQQNDFTPNLPQLPDIGWAQNFVDKEWFFHVLTGIAYKIAGQDGVEFLAHLLSLLVILVLYRVGRRYLGPVECCLLIFSTLLFFALWTYRITTLRPHVLAIALSILIADSFLNRNRIRLFFYTVLFGLSYHAFYLHMVIVGCLGFVSYYKKDFKVGQILPYAAGILCGFVLHPGFPDLISISWQHVLVAFDHSGVPAHYMPLETRPVSTKDQLIVYFPVLIAILSFLAMTNFRREAIEKEDKSHQMEYAFLMLAFFCLFQLQPRAVEYLIPFSLLYFITAVSRSAYKNQILSIVMTVFISVGVYHFLNLQDFRSTATAERNKNRLVYDKLKSHKPGKIVHSNWAEGSIIMWMLPEFKQLQLLDPSFLLVHSPKKFEAFSKFVVMNDQPYKLIRDQLEGDYFVSNTKILNRILLKDSGFKLIQRGPNTIFKVLDSENPSFLKFRARKYPNSASASRIGIDPGQKCQKYDVDQSAIASNLDDRLLVIRGNHKQSVRLKFLNRKIDFIVEAADLPLDEFTVVLERPLGQMGFQGLEVCATQKEGPSFIDVQAFSMKEVQETCESLLLGRPERTGARSKYCSENVVSMSYESSVRKISRSK